MAPDRRREDREARARDEDPPSADERPEPVPAPAALARSSAGKRGEETIDGQKTARYHVDVDVAKALKNAGISKAGARLLRQQLNSTTVPIDVGVDEDGYLRREHLKLAARPFTVTLTMTLSDFGRDVSIEPPPRASSVDA